MLTACAHWVSRQYKVVYTIDTNLIGTGRWIAQQHEQYNVRAGVTSAHCEMKLDDHQSRPDAVLFDRYTYGTECMTS